MNAIRREIDGLKDAFYGAVAIVAVALPFVLCTMSIIAIVI